MKEFDINEVLKILKQYEQLLNTTAQEIQRNNSAKYSIKKAAEEYAEYEALNTLSSISIEELSNYKNGLRLKYLTDNKINTIGDIIQTSTKKLSDIQGISEQTALIIKKIAAFIANKVKQETKIKLSADNQNKYATALITKIYIYKSNVSYIEQCKAFYIKNSNQINQAIATCQPMTKNIKWFFTSKSKKTVALDTFGKLKETLNSDYYKNIQNLVSLIDKNNNASSSVTWQDFTTNNIDYITILEQTNPGLLGTDDVKYGLPQELAEQIKEEVCDFNGLKCTLRRYQEWGVKYILNRKNVLLGDEMGLGKTIQAIAAMVSLKNAGEKHFLVVCPASVLTNWCREISIHSDLSVVKIHGDDKQEYFDLWLKNGGVAVTTYETTALFKFEETFKLSMLIVDEAHYIKNPKAIRTKNTKRICKSSSRILFMTGTALENRVEEMITLIAILQPEIAKQIKRLSFMSTAESFKEKIAPVYYRRKRIDVLTELPELVESDEWCTMTAEEEKIYEVAILGKRFADARRVSWNIDDIANSSKANRLLEILEEAEEENRKVIVFSFFLDTLQKVCDLLKDKCVGPINGSVSPQRRQEIIDEFTNAPNGSVLVAQIQSGGTGLNIQCASIVVICEPQFKPSIENQAISRAYRIGQARNVLVYRLLCEDSIDEKLSKLLDKKQLIFDTFADESVLANMEIDEQTFTELANEEAKRIAEKRGIITSD